MPLTAYNIKVSVSISACRAPLTDSSIVASHDLPGDDVAIRSYARPIKSESIHKLRANSEIIDLFACDRHE